MIKLIIFDLDGVLIDSKILHFEALNEVLEKIDLKYSISLEDNLNKFDGMTTSEKLFKLHSEKGLPLNLFNKISEDKRKILYSKIENNIKINPNIYTILDKFIQAGIKLHVASNADNKFVNLMLEKTFLKKYFNHIISRDDCLNSKPNSEMYMKSILKAGVEPFETLILEDSLVGQQAAIKSGANLLVVEGINNLSFEKIQKEIDKYSVLYPKDISYISNINIVIPASGLGSRFAQNGYKMPKPLIDINGKIMIDLATSFLKFPNAKFIFVVQKEHVEKFNLKTILKFMKQNCEVVEIDGLTQGAACSVLKAKEFINNDDHLIISNCDQIINFNCANFINQIINKNCDGGLLSFIDNSGSTKWSFAKVDESNCVMEVAEKIPISNIATAGLYHWRKGSDFIKDAEEMISAKETSNKEYYVAPVYNRGIKRGLKILNYLCDKMIGLGTPSDLEDYLKLIK